MGRACLALQALPPDIHGEHKYHSLTVMCHLNADGWAARPQTHMHTRIHTRVRAAIKHRDNLKADLLGSREG